MAVARVLVVALMPAAARDAAANFLSRAAGESRICKRRGQYAGIRFFSRQFPVFSGSLFGGVECDVCLMGVGGIDAEVRSVSFFVVEKEKNGGSYGSSKDF